MYGCIHVGSIIMTSSISGSSSMASYVPVLADGAPKSYRGLLFSPVLGAMTSETRFALIECSDISSQKTTGGTGKHRDPMFAKLSASSLLALPMCDTSHPSN